MAVNVSLRPKIALGLVLVSILFVILLLQDDDTLLTITKLRCGGDSSRQCRPRSASTVYGDEANANSLQQQHSLPIHFTIKFKQEPTNNEVIDVLFLFAHVDENPELRNKFSACLKSLFTHTFSPLHLHVITDNSSVQHALKVLRDSSEGSKSFVEVTLYDVVNITDPLKTLIASMQPHFSYKLGAYYSDALFYVSTGLFQVLPVEKVIMLDVDVKFIDDIRNLYAHFKHFQPEAVLGIAREQQPVYRHILHSYRNAHNDTRAGAPPPNGLTGFNSGVLLLHLEKMRNSQSYLESLNVSAIHKLVEKYMFKGHLGDQDFYSLLSFDHEELFYVLPCTWNRQLCQWWRRHGYESIFDDYYACSGKINLLHGNCNTFIPN